MIKFSLSVILNIIFSVLLSISSGCTGQHNYFTSSSTLKEDRKQDNGIVFEYQDITDQFNSDSKEMPKKKVGRIITRGFPKGKKYIFCTFSKDDRLSIIDFCEANDWGELITIGKERKLLSDTNLFLEGFMNGERIIYAAATDDFKAHWKTIVDPNPIQTTWEDGATITVEMISPDATQFCMQGKAFSPNEELKFTSNSNNEVMRFNIKAEADGTWTSILLPAVIGYTGGINLITIDRVFMKQKRTLRYFWGDVARQHKDQLP